MRKLSRRSKAIVVVCGVVAVVVNAGAAWAYWELSGSATATSGSGSVLPISASGTPSGGALLYPSVRRGIKVTVTNPNAFPIRVIQVKRSPAPVVVDGPHVTAGCVTSGVQLTNPTYAVSWTVAGNTTSNFTVSNGITMTNASDSACQGATFQLPILVTATA